MPSVRLRLGVVCAAGLVGLAVACAGPESHVVVPALAGPQPAYVSTLPPVELVPQDLDQSVQNLGPEILLPTMRPADEKVAEVGGVVIRKSHVYDRWLEREPKQAKGFQDLLIFDALLAYEAKRHGITVDPRRIDEAVDKSVKQLRARVEKEWQDELRFEDYCYRKFGMSPTAYRQWRRLLLARDRYRSYVIRYLATLEDRVQVRLFAHSDRKVVEDVRRRVQQGADFKTLVLRKRSQHKPSNRNGGLMPPIGRDFPSPWTEHAFRLQAGGLSDVIEVEGSGGTKAYYVLFCLSRTEARSHSFKEARKELDEELSRNPVTAEERRAMFIRLSSRSEALKNPDTRR